MTKKILFLGLLMAGFVNACFATDFLKNCVDTIPMLVRVTNRITPKDHSCKPVLQKVRDYNYYFNGEDDNKILSRFSTSMLSRVSGVKFQDLTQSLASSLGQNVGKPMLFVGMNEGLTQLSKVEQLKHVNPILHSQLFSNDGKLIVAGVGAELLYGFAFEVDYSDSDTMNKNMKQKARNIVQKTIICTGHKMVQPYTDSFIEQRVGEGFAREALKCVANIATMQLISIGVNSCIQK